jgi:diguanylate cyclase (GGDEF)-like protein
MVLTLGAVGVGVAEYLVVPSARPWLANGAWLCSAVVAVIGVSLAVRSSSARARAGWLLLLWGCLAWTLGELFWIAYALTSYPSSPSVADLCWLAFAAFATAAVLRLGVSARGRPVSGLELAPLAVAVCAVIAALMWNEIRTSPLSTAGELTTLAYAVLYVSAALVMLQSVITGALSLRGNPGLALVLAGLVVNAVAFVLWAPLLLKASYQVGDEIDALWTVGMILVGLGAATVGPVASSADVEELGHRRGAVLPSVTFALLALVQSILILTDAPRGAEFVLCLGLAISGATLGARASKLRREQAVLYTRLQEREGQLREANERLSQESRRDSLTGLANRLRLDEDLAELAAQAERHGRTYCLVLCDLDRFKDYNDALGHQAGDAALREVARALSDEARGGDRVYRYGGEELLLILPDHDLQEGSAVAERHRFHLARRSLPHPRNPQHGVVTFSAGVAAAQPGETPRQVLRRADAALYRAKSSGRNRVAVAALDPDQSALIPARTPGAASA